MRDTLRNISKAKIPGVSVQSGFLKHQNYGAALWVLGRDCVSEPNGLGLQDRIFPLVQKLTFFQFIQIHQ